MIIGEKRLNLSISKRQNNNGKFDECGRNVTSANKMGKWQIKLKSGK
jgi:hypothetical protein